MKVYEELVLSLMILTYFENVIFGVSEKMALIYNVHCCFQIIGLATVNNTPFLLAILLSKES